MAASVAPAIVAGCTPQTPVRWSAAGSEEQALSEISIDREGGFLQVDVHLPAGYEPAEDFVQRATLRFGESSDDTASDAAPTTLTRPIRLEQSGLSQSFVFEVPPAGEWGAEHATLTLLVGFCEPDAKDVCYIDSGDLAVIPRSGGAALREIVFRAERPE